MDKQLKQAYDIVEQNLVGRHDYLMRAIASALVAARNEGIEAAAVEAEFYKSEGVILRGDDVRKLREGTT